MSKDNSPIHEVSENSHQLTVVTLLEILPTEIIVLSFRSIGSKHIPHDILLSREFLQILMSPNSPILRCGNLVSLEIKELICRHIVRKDISAISLQHRREYDTVEHDIILTDKVYQLGILRLPPCLPTLRKKFLSVGNVTDRCIEPHIKHFALSSFHRNRNTPIQVTAHCARLKMSIQPRFALTINIGLPLLVLLENPLAEPRLILVERQVPVLGLHLLRLASAQCRFRVDKFLRAERTSALLALVAISIRIAALRASTCYITVCEESLSLRIEELLSLLRNELSIVIKLAEKLRSILFVHLGSRPGINIEIDTKSGERILDNLMILVHNILRRTTLTFRSDSNRHTMLITSANIKDILTTHSEIPDIDISRHINTGKMTYVHRAVRIRQRTGNKCSFEFFVHIINNL